MKRALAVEGNTKFVELGVQFQTSFNNFVVPAFFERLLCQRASNKASLFLES